MFHVLLDIRFLRVRFKYLAEQYELREQQLGKINEQIQLESQLNEAKLAKTKMESTIEKEILLKEKEAVLLDLMSTKQAIIDMQEREKALKGQLNMYTEKYAEFQSSLKKSNDVFSTYKTEIESVRHFCESHSKHMHLTLDVHSPHTDEQANQIPGEGEQRVAQQIR